MGLFNANLHILPGNIIVQLEGSRPFVGPVVDDPGHFLRVGNLVQGDDIHPFPLDEGPCDVHLGPGHLPGIDVLFDVEVRLRLNAAGSTDSRRPAGKIKTGKGERHLGDVKPVFKKMGVKKMLVQHHQPRNDGFAGTVNYNYIFR